MAVKEILEHEVYKFTLEDCRRNFVVLTVAYDNGADERNEVITTLNKEACVRLATKLLNAAEGLQ